MSKAHANIVHTISDGKLNVMITLDLYSVPARWSFHLNRGSSGLINVDGVENPLNISAPIDADQKRQIHEWLKSFKRTDLPHWTFYRGILIKIAEMKKEEIQLSENHEEVENFMKTKNPGQDPPQ